MQVSGKGRQDLMFLSINFVDTVRILCVDEVPDHNSAGRTQSLEIERVRERERERTS